ncbi:MAG: heme-binding domain-containing protein [Chlorobiaceae bacterium]
MTFSLKSMVSWTLLVLMLMQFIPLNRINPPVSDDVQTPFIIKSLLKKACYDCHSNETRWRGIAYIAPISWVLSSTVASGRNVVNFSLWNNKKKEQIKVQQAEIRKVIAEGPVHQQLYYFWNSEAQLNTRETQVLIQWINESLDEQ